MAVPDPTAPGGVVQSVDQWLRYDPPAAAAAQPAAELHETPLRFSGTGAAYFRIWIVHALLTLLTLGVYSAWAKVRKARWFAQHTELAGDRFDFHGQPLRILAGRAVALALLAAWSFGFSIEPWLGLAVLALFCVLGPLLFASAQRFRLANTSWRGLRFDFAAPRPTLYAVCVPLLLLWTIGSVAEAFELRQSHVVAYALLPLLGMPWAHARLKHLQHAHAQFGDQRFSFKASPGAFYGLYAKGITIAIVLSVAVGGLMLALTSLLSERARAQGWDGGDQLRGLLGALATVLLLWVLGWPYFAARMQQLVWSRTRLGELQFKSRIQSRRLIGLVFRHSLGVLFTCGLWWPFAAVAIARYRVQSLVVLSPGELPLVQDAPQPAGGPQATGEGAADFFGLDLGW